ncbi:unnamed protein product [Bursaphelenchus okinawaensis]|uniref:Uncharacterized protein n=1 Tax=Bursaphelenchus okinawaensis TaxID=465554 RepID=A0A811KUZ3_9BILA|nr:unnamed protein product [Bursaphelenchus okinawaensis]CAG9113722.1 unnamed protein product [Bursaphelenchus okinawaensis]
MFNLPQNEDLLSYFYLKEVDGSRTSSLSQDRVRTYFQTNVLEYIATQRAAQPVWDKKQKLHRDEPGHKKARLANKVIKTKQHPAKLHPEILFNEYGANKCGCSRHGRESVIHCAFPNEIPPMRCQVNSNNITRLYQYFIQVSSTSHYFRKVSTIESNGFTYNFEGFTLLFHRPVSNFFLETVFTDILPGFDVRVVELSLAEGYTVQELEMFHTYLFEGLLELYSIDRGITPESCSSYHILPRFVHQSKVDGVQLRAVLPMSCVLQHIIENFNRVMTKKSTYGKSLKDELICNPAKRPCCLRVDVDKRNQNGTIRHFTLRTSKHASVAKQNLITAQKRYKALKDKLTSQKDLVSENEREEFKEVMELIRDLKHQSAHKRSVPIDMNIESFVQTGFCFDVVHHALISLAIVFKVRYHWSLDAFEQSIDYRFKKRELLEQAFTHPTYHTNFLVDMDHLKNTLRNCGYSQIPEVKSTAVGEKRKGIENLIETMALPGSNEEEESALGHNERLEFLGDAVVELVVTYHLFFLLPHVEEGVLAAMRSKFVRNLHLGAVGQRLNMHKFLLRAHGVEIMKEDGMKKDVANAFEALMAAVYLDSDVETCDRILSNAIFGNSPDILHSWTHPKEYPLKANSPSDRHWIPKVKWLQKLTELEDYIGIYFHHIRVLARAFARRNVGYNNLTQGHNQTLEFLGDTVLQFFVSDYVYRHFPHHHEGHLSLLRSCLVSNKTQSVICDELDLTSYLVSPSQTQGPLGMKDKADLVESLIGAIYVDRGFKFCEAFIRVCFYPRLSYFIFSARWNDPKSQLQQCCLSLKNQGIEADEVPEYRVTGMEGPTNSREYKLVVYYKGKRLGSGSGKTVHDAEMDAAENALVRNSYLFSQFNLEKTYMGERIKAYHKLESQPISDDSSDEEERRKDSDEPTTFEAVSISDEDSD